MKKCALFVMFIAIVFTSCSVDSDPGPQFHNEVMPVLSVEMPEQFVHGEVYSIGVNYTKPNSCYIFSDFFYEIDGNERTVAVINNVYTDSNANCTGEPEVVTAAFNFAANSTETYIFKFFQGEDATGEDQYYIIEVPVVDSRSVSVGNTRR